MLLFVVCWLMFEVYCLMCVICCLLRVWLLFGSGLLVGVCCVLFVFANCVFVVGCVSCDVRRLLLFVVCRSLFVRCRCGWLSVVCRRCRWL